MQDGKTGRIPAEMKTNVTVIPLFLCHLHNERIRHQLFSTYISMTTKSRAPTSILVNDAYSSNVD